MKPIRHAAAGLYAGLWFLFLLWQPVRLMEFQLPQAVTAWFDVVWAGAALLALLLWGLWRERPVRLMLLGLLWICVSLWIAAWDKLTAGGTARSLLSGAWAALQHARPILGPMVYALGFCFFLGYVADQGQLQRLLRLTCAFWTLWVGALAAAGLWAVYAGVRVENLGSHFLGVNASDHRLYLFAYCTDSGGIMASGLLVALLGCGLSRGRVGKGLYLLCAGAMLAALSLTDGRSSFLALGACLGLICAALALRRARWALVVRLLLAALLSAAGAAAVTLLCVWLNGLLGGLAGLPVRQVRLGLMASAQAEGAAVSHRSLLGEDPLSGRGDVWAAVFRLLGARPALLLSGTTILDWKESLMPFTTTGLRYAHAHSIYLQILMELGVPGLVLCAAFLCCLIPRAWHVLMDGGTPLWQRLTVLPVVMILLGELVECHTMPGLMLPFVPVVYTGMGVVCGLGRSRPPKG